MTFALFAPESHDRINFSALGERAAPPAVGDAVGVGVQSRRRVLRPKRLEGIFLWTSERRGRRRREREGEGMREFLARGRHMPVTHRRAQERGGPTEFASSSAALKFGSFGIKIFHELICMDCARHHLRARSASRQCCGKRILLSPAPAACGRARAVAAAASVFRPSFQVLGKNKMGRSSGGSRAEEEEDENMTKMGGNKMDRLRTSSSSSSSSRAAVAAAAAAVAQFFSADERSWMVL